MLVVCPAGSVSLIAFHLHSSNNHGGSTCENLVNIHLDAASLHVSFVQRRYSPTRLGGTCKLYHEQHPRVCVERGG